MTFEDIIKNNIKDVLKPGHTTVDIGACVGDVSEALIGHCKMTYLFEPNKDNYSTLKRKFKDNCVIENYAVGDINDTVKFYKSQRFGIYGGNIIGKDVSLTDSTFVYDITCTTLDEYFKSININLIKIDVEGAEYKVLSGGVSTLKRDMPYIFLETHSDKDYPEIRALLTNIGYKLYDLISMRECTDIRSYQIFCKANIL